MAQNPAIVRKPSILLLSSIVCSVLFFLFAPCTSAETDTGDLREVIAEGRAILGDDTTPAQAKALALNDARRIAVERAAGVMVRSSSVVYNSELISDLISAFSKGLIVKEDILSEGLRTEEGHAAYVCRIKATIKPLRQRKQKDIRIIKAEVSRADRPFSSSAPVFQDNDEIRIRVKTEGDLNINVFSVSQDGRIALLLPNPYVKLKQVSGGQDFIFPDESMRSSGFKLRVHTPKNLTRAYETIVIIATKEQKDFLSSKDRDATLSDLMGELSLLEQSSWADATIGYEVRR
ncbi:MAG: hypothetical protein CVU71_14260 [Deltaproteobacteria bacterium HGW-Deltaproteobacteria-6]|jgi:hypothetical protein|nr:MAG: hypothetical protein CVU71_14260 [Deltaproteobacteria bacterium HGW-Deltaproteobacteria-6]